MLRCIATSCNILQFTTDPRAIAIKYTDLHKPPMLYVCIFKQTPVTNDQHPSPLKDWQLSVASAARAAGHHTDRPGGRVPSPPPDETCLHAPLVSTLTGRVSARHTMRPLTQEPRRNRRQKRHAAPLFVTRNRRARRRNPIRCETGWPDGADSNDVARPPRTTLTPT